MQIRIRRLVEKTFVKSAINRLSVYFKIFLNMFDGFFAVRPCKFFRLQKSAKKLNPNLRIIFHGRSINRKPAARMPRIKFPAAHGNEKSRLLRTDIVRTPSNSGIDLPRAHSFLNRRRIFQFEKAHIFFPIQTCLGKRAAQNRVPAGKAHRRDFFPFQIGDAF